MNTSNQSVALTEGSVFIITATGILVLIGLVVMSS
jgi:hypothetical protein